MIRLVITADDRLYHRLATRAELEGDESRRAADALEGLALARAAAGRPGMILLDMALRSADTLLEILSSRPETAVIPLLAVVAGGQLPLSLRRHCRGVIDASFLEAVD